MVIDTSKPVEVVANWDETIVHAYRRAIKDQKDKAGD